MNDQEPKSSGEAISLEDQHAFIDKVIDASPPIDRQTGYLEAYEVHYARPTGYVSVSRPSYPEVGDTTDRPLIDDAFSVVVREEDEHADGTTTVTTKTYAVHLNGFFAEYREKEELLDSSTGKPVTQPQRYGLENLAEQLKASSKSQQAKPVFDQARFNEVMGILDTLRSEDRINIRPRQV